jgi:hypothetical protein
MPTTTTLRRTIAAGLAAALALVAAPAPASALDPAIAFWQESTAGLAVNGTYTPVVGNFGNALTPADDILWYAPGAATDYLWLSNNDTTFDTAPSPSQVSGSYTPVVGDFAGNGLDDIVWYAPGSTQDWLWTSTGSGFTSSPLSISGTYDPSVLEDEAGKADIVWAKPNGGAGYVWSFEGMGTYLSTPMVSPPGSRALVGFFGAGACADIFWYAPGPAADSLWMMNCAGTAGSTFAQTVNGTYQPVVADLRDDLDGQDEIFWYRTGASSTMWSPNGDGTWQAKSLTVPLQATPLPAGHQWGLIHFWSPTQQDLVFWGEGGADAHLGPLTNTEMPAGSIPVIGAFVGHSDDILWYRPGAGAERLFHRVP